MNREQRLRGLILDRYASLRSFARAADVPCSSLMTVLRRGVGGASFDLVMQICRQLDVDPALLAPPSPAGRIDNGCPPGVCYPYSDTEPQGGAAFPDRQENHTERNGWYERNHHHAYRDCCAGGRLSALRALAGKDMGR